MAVQPGDARHLVREDWKCVMILSESDHEVGRAQTHWTDEQREHLARLIREGAKILYWCSDAHGRPANHCLDCLEARDWTVKPGSVQKLSVKEVSICSSNALHGTTSPHKWKGVRVWMVGLVCALDSEEDKFGALQREIIGEILPEECLDPSVGVRIGRKDLSRADLSRAYLSEADLSGAFLSGANLSCADLSGANLSCADLSGADLSWADLLRANLSVANLSRADLSRANLSGADLSQAYLSGANLSGANLLGADLLGAFRGESSAPKGWKKTSTNHLERISP